MIIKLDLFNWTCLINCSQINKDLRQTAEAYQDGSCAAAVGMMLYAGIRPHEVARLTWAQVDLRERAIYILPQHSKTGGWREDMPAEVAAALAGAAPRSGVEW